MLVTKGFLLEFVIGFNAITEPNFTLTWYQDIENQPKLFF